MSPRSNAGSPEEGAALDVASQCLKGSEGRSAGGEPMEQVGSGEGVMKGTHSSPAASLLRIGNNGGGRYTACVLRWLNHNNQ